MDPHELSTTQTHGVSRTGGSLLRKDGRASGDTDVAHQHADGRGQPERSPSEPFTEERSADSPKPVPAGWREIIATSRKRALEVDLTRLEDLR